jgi:hypothetical protein
VLVETPDGQSEQRQVSNERQLALFLRELGQTELDARAAASQAWKKRPPEAGSTAARPGEGLRSSTGLSSWKLTAVILALIALFVVLSLIVFTGR